MRFFRAMLKLGFLFNQVAVSFDLEVIVVVVVNVLSQPLCQPQGQT